MARIRSIKPQFFKSTDLSELPISSRYLFAGLWCQADKEGRLKDNPKFLRAEIFPYDDLTISDVDSGLSGLARIGSIVRYAVAGQCYIQITNFEKHQKPYHKEADSTIPPVESRDRNWSRSEPELVQGEAALSLVFGSLSSVSGPLSMDVLPGQLEVEFENEVVEEEEWEALDDETRKRLEVAAGSTDEAARRFNEQREKNRKRDQAKIEAGLKRPPKQKKEPVQGATETLEGLWYHEMKQKFPDITVGVWGGQEAGQVANLVRKYNEELVGLTFKYVIRNWDRVCTKIFKGNAVSPNLSMILKLHQGLFSEAQTWEKVRVILEEKQRFMKENPNAWKLPSDLSARYAAVAADIKALGLE